MAYSVRFERRALKELQRVNKIDQRRIVAAVGQLSDDPRPPSVKKLAGRRDVWRLRVGTYRVLYVIEDQELRILVVKVGHRRDVYS